MRRVSKLTKALACALAVCLLAGCGQQEAASQEAVEAKQVGQSAGDTLQALTLSQVGNPTHDKEETITAKLDAEGGLKELTAEVLLKNPGDGQPLQDITNLTDVSNAEGDEEFTLGNDGSLTWENKGVNIRYKGTAGGQLPLTVAVHYTLDGEPISGEELVGKSGHLTMRFTYQNHTSTVQKVEDESYTVQVPFMAITLVPLDSDVFHNVTVTDGELISADDTTLAVGMVMPGLADSLNLAGCKYTEDIDIPDSFELEADVTDFELSFTATMVSNGLLEDFDPDDLDDDDLEMDGTVDDVDDAIDDMLSGTNSLSEGIAKLQDAVKQLTDGLVKLDDGMDALKQGAATLKGYNSQLNQGGTQITALLGGMDSYLEAQVKAGIKASLIAGGRDEASITDADYPEATVLAGKLTMMEQMQLVTAEQKAGLQAVLDAWDTATDEQKQQVRTSLSLKAIGESYAAGVAQYTAGVEQLYTGIAAIKDATGETTDAGDEFTKAFNEVQKGIGDFQAGIRDFRDDGVQELKDFADDAKTLQQVANRLKALKQADSEYTSFTGLLPGKTGSVSFVLETEKLEKD